MNRTSNYVNYTFTVTYDREIVAYAVSRFFRNQMDWKYLLAAAIMVVITISVYVSGDRGWLLGFVSACLFAVLLLTVFIYFRLRSDGLGKLSKNKSLTASFTLSDKSVHMSSENGSAEIQWESIERILKYPRVWLFVFRATGYFTLPIEQVDEDIKQFMADRVRSA